MKKITGTNYHRCARYIKDGKPVTRKAKVKPKATPKAKPIAEPPAGLMYTGDRKSGALKWHVRMLSKGKALLGQDQTYLNAYMAGNVYKDWEYWVPLETEQSALEMGLGYAPGINPTKIKDYINALEGQTPAKPKAKPKEKAPPPEATISASVIDFLGGLEPYSNQQVSLSRLLPMKGRGYATITVYDGWATNMHFMLQLNKLPDKMEKRLRELDARILKKPDRAEQEANLVKTTKTIIERAEKDLRSYGGKLTPMMVIDPTPSTDHKHADKNKMYYNHFFLVHRDMVFALEERYYRLVASIPGATLYGTGDLDTMLIKKNGDVIGAVMPLRSDVSAMGKAEKAQVAKYLPEWRKFKP
jgi:hypothetical protein